MEFNRSGQVLYRYQPAAGPGELNHPSLVELLPSGVFMLNDDYNDRMVAIDPSTGALVWQYGQTGVAGTAPGLLNTPDGLRHPWAWRRHPHASLHRVMRSHLVLQLPSAAYEY